MGIESAIDAAIVSGDINVLFDALKDARLYAVCTQENGVTVPWLVSSLENAAIAVLTVSEHLAWLENALSATPARDRMLFNPIGGGDVVAMGLNDAIEVYIQFENRAFKIPRNYFEHWKSTQ